MELEKLLYTPNKAADILKVTRQTIYNMVNDGRLEAIKIGGRLRIKAKSIAQRI